MKTLKTLKTLKLILLALFLLPGLAAAETVATMSNDNGGRVVLTNLQGNCPLGSFFAFNQKADPGDVQLRGCWVAEGGSVHVQWTFFGQTVFSYSIKEFRGTGRFRARWDQAIAEMESEGIEPPRFAINGNPVASKD